MRLILTTLFLFLSVCSAVAQDSTGTVIFFRVEEAPKVDSGKPKVYMDGRHVFSLPESEFVGFKLPAGKYVFKMKNKHTETPLTVESGKTYYIRVSEVVAGFSFQRNLFLMQPEQATLQMRDMRPLEDKNIKDKSLQIVTTKPTP